MKKIKSLAVIVAIMTIAVSCSTKPVSENCALCGEKATKNYINPQSMEVTLSIDKDKPVMLNPGEKTAFCDKCFNIVETAIGKSK